MTRLAGYEMPHKFPLPLIECFHGRAKLAPCFRLGQFVHGRALAAASASTFRT